MSNDGEITLVEADGDRFEFGITVERLDSLLATLSGHFESPERGTCVEDIVAVDPDGTCPDLVGQEWARPMSRVQTAAARP